MDRDFFRNCRLVFSEYVSKLSKIYGHAKRIPFRKRNLIILDHAGWKVWTSDGTRDLEVTSLPQKFTLYLNPLLYIYTGNFHKVEWSEFQQQALNWLQRSEYQIAASYYFCDIATGLPEGETAILSGMEPIQIVKGEGFHFQSSKDFPLSKIHDYLKRFNVTFMPVQVKLKPFSGFSLIGRRGFILPDLQQQQNRFRIDYYVNLIAIIICSILSIGILSSALNWWEGLRQLKQYQSHSLLTIEQQDQAKLYQDFTQLTASAMQPDWSSYEKFIKVWRPKIVVTQITYQNTRISCHFILHPDYQHELDNITDWVERDLPGSTLIDERGENVEFHLSFATN